MAAKIRVVGVTAHQVAFWIDAVYVQAFKDGEIFAMRDGDPQSPLSVTPAIRATAGKVLKKNAAHMNTLSSPPSVSSLRTSSSAGKRTRRKYEEGMNRLPAILRREG